MRSELEIEYLLKAIDAFERRLIVVSPHFEILAAKCHPISLDVAACIYVIAIN